MIIKGRPLIDWKTGNIVGRDPDIIKYTKNGKVYFKGLEGDLKRRKKDFKTTTRIMKSNKPIPANRGINHV